MPSGETKRGALGFILVTLIINSMGIGLMMPVMPSLLTELTQLPVSEAARWGGALSVVYALMQFVFGPTLGNLSDRFGRRPVLLVSMFSMAIDYLVMALSWHLAILFIGRTLSGVAGATFSAASAYIADVSSKEDRAKNFGLVGAGFGVGFVLGPMIGGYLGEYGPRAPFFAAAALSFINFLFGYFMLPETLKPENRRAFDWKRANPLGALKQIAKYPAVRTLLLAVFLFDIAHYVYPAVWSFYAEEVFAWTPADIGLSLAFVGVGFAFVQGYLIRVLEPKLGPGRTLLIGLSANLVAFAGLAFANSGAMAYAMIVFASFGAMATPAFTGLMSNRMPDNAQGELQGLISSAAGLSLVISPFVMTQIFAHFSGPGATISFPGAPFALAWLLILASMLIALPFMKLKDDRTSGSDQVERKKPAE
ncbi:TCR/Tet family MFS transporter [uncultured Roseibium sp.]|uniref:TCR/Tet family MFS transporter n=1 Tax=uncultured Roseibium sp. TaxID=1936171 RepID=UPI00262A35B0|nr:TCR/Tet family MFS transporter [uncultured Roseibium sp.]